VRSTDSLVKIGKWSDGEQIAQIWCQNEGAYCRDNFLP